MKEAKMKMTKEWLQYELGIEHDIVDVSYDREYGIIDFHLVGENLPERKEGDKIGIVLYKPKAKDK